MARSRSGRPIEARRRWLIAASALLVGINLLRIAAVDGLIALVVGVVTSITASIGIVLFFAGRDRRRRGNADANDLFREHGTIRPAEVRASSYLRGEWSAALRPGPTWLGGTLVLRSERAVWLPAWNGIRLGFPELDIPWSDVAQAEAQPVPGILHPAILHFTFRDGTTLEIMTRYARRAEDALSVSWAMAKRG
jgi:hypothetical protein